MSRPPKPIRTASRALALLAASSVLAVAAPARAHFLWMLAEPDGDGDGVVVRAFLSEPPVPDLPSFMKSIEAARYSADSRPLQVDRGEETFIVRCPSPVPDAIDGVCPLGLMNRDGTTFRLFYTARVQFGPIPAEQTELEDNLRIRLLESDGEDSIVQVTFDGKPAAGAIVKAYLEDGDDLELRADAEGRLDNPGLGGPCLGLLAKWADGTPGELEGEAFDETRHYATLTLAPDEVIDRIAEEADALTTRTVETLAPMPEPINSFGGAVLDDWLYVYSGHTGTTHRYHTGTTNPHFRRLNLEGGTAWEDLPMGPAVQGVSLVAHEGMLYRVGGMAAHNAESEPEDLVSIAEVARFDPLSRTWADLPPLPEPRSTHDAMVVGDHLYIVGGWAMLGGGSDNAYFHEDALRLDLNDPEPGWEAIPTPPFRRRALAAATIDGKLYVLGGLTEDGDVVLEVDIYDPGTGHWSKGPELPGKAIVGFAPSAFGVEDRLYVSGGDGIVHRLDESGIAWERVGRLAVPRITHRLLPGTDGDLLAVGGHSAGHPVRSIERFRPGPADNRH